MEGEDLAGHGGVVKKVVREGKGNFPTRGSLVTGKKAFTLESTFFAYYNRIGALDSVFLDSEL